MKFVVGALCLPVCFPWQQLIDELDAIAASGIPVQRPNSMNNYGVILNLVGLQPHYTRLQNQVFSPIARMLFPQAGQGYFNSHHTFVVQYVSHEKKAPTAITHVPNFFEQVHSRPESSTLFILHRYEPKGDKGLDMHTDASDVTFNACLGEEFTGAPLVFCGLQGSPSHRKQTLTYAHEKGRCVTTTIAYHCLATSHTSFTVILATARSGVSFSK